MSDTPSCFNERMKDPDLPASLTGYRISMYAEPANFTSSLPYQLHPSAIGAIATLVKGL